MTVIVDLRTLLCTTPNCAGDAAGRVAGLPFCQGCLDAEPRKVLKALAVRAEMRRQAELEDRRRGDQLARRRRAREAKRDRILDGRTRTVLQLGRLRDQAARRGDEALAVALGEAVDVVAAALVGRKAVA